MAVNRQSANQKKLSEADEIQHKTHDALHRIEREVEETAVLGAHTLEQLRTQGQQMVGWTLYHLREVYSVRLNFRALICAG